MKKFEVLFSGGNIRKVNSEQLRTLGDHGMINDKCFIRVSGKDIWHNPNKVKGLHVVKAGPSETTLRREESANAHSDSKIIKYIGAILGISAVCAVFALPFMTEKMAEDTKMKDDVYIAKLNERLRVINNEREKREFEYQMNLMDDTYNSMIDAHGGPGVVNLLREIERNTK